MNVNAWFDAAAAGKLEKLRALLAKHPEPDILGSNGQSPLHRAAEEGQAEALDLLIEAGYDVNKADDNGRTPLTQAAWLGQLEAARRLLAAGARAEGDPACNASPLMFAVHEGHAEIVDLLLAAGADVRRTTVEGGTALHRAAGQGKTALAGLLIDRGASVNAATTDGYTPLHLAIRQGKMGTVRLLIQRGADVNLKTADGRTPLLEAVLHGRTKFVKVFLDAKADPNVPVQCEDIFQPALARGVTPLMAAAHAGRLEIVEMLLAAGANPSAADDRGRTALDIAEREGHAEVIDRIAAVAEPSKRRGKKASTPLGPRLVRSAAEGRADDVRKLLEQGANPNSRDPNPSEQGRTALIAAASEGRADCVRALLEAGARHDLATTTNQWLGPTETPLIAAARAGHAECVRALLGAGAEPDAPDDQGSTPLIEAARGGFAEVVALLLDAGADPMHRPPAGEGEGEGEDDREEPMDALSMAVSLGHAQVADLMLSRGVAPSPESIVLAAEQCDVGLIGALIGRGLGVNVAGAGGRTPLHAACAMAATVVEHDPDVEVIDQENERYLEVAAARQVAAVRFLLGEGADANARAVDRRTPLHAAASMESTVKYVHAKDPDGNCKHTSGEINTSPIVELLLEAGADPRIRDERGETPLMLAARVNPRWSTDPTPVIVALVRAGADPNAANAVGQTALVAPEADAVKVVRALIEAGADVNHRDAEGRTPLIHFASIAYGQLGMITALIDAGADVEMRDAQGRSAIDVADEQGAKKVVKRLQAAGATLDTSPHRLLLKAVDAGQLKKARAALEAGADPHHPFGATDAFARAIARRNGKLIALLLQRGADPNHSYPDCNDRTPLLIALESDREAYGADNTPSLAPALLAAGADPNIRNRKGWSPLAYAAWMRNKPLVDALKARGASVEGDPLATLFLEVLAMNERGDAPELASAVERVAAQTGERPRPIEWLPSARAFFVTAAEETEAAMREHDLPTVSRFGVEWNVLDAKAQALSESLRSELAPLGCTVIDAGRPIGCGPSGKFLVLLPTPDPFVALAACGPSPGGDYGEDGGLALPDVVHWFRTLSAEVPITIWGAGRDFVDVAFDREIGEEESRALADRIYTFCPDSVDQGAGTKAKLAARLRERRRVYFWWD